MRKFSLVLCVLALSALCACGDAASASSQDTEGGTLTVCVDGTGANEMYMEPIFAEFRAQNPGIALEVEYMPVYKSGETAMIEERTAALARMRTRLMSGEGADVYLFFNHVSDQDGYMFFPDLERTILSGSLHDLDFLFADSRFQAEDYIPGLQTLGVSEGKSYLLPLSYTAPVMVAVEPALQESGFAADAANMTEFAEQMMALDESQRPYWSAGVASLLFKAVSLPPVSVEDAAVLLNDPAWQQTLSLVKTTLEQCGPAGDFYEMVDYEAQARSGAALLTGAAVTMPPYALRLLEEDGFTVRALPIPNENGGVTASPYMTAAVAASCRDTDAAASLLLFLLDETVQGCRTLETSGMPANLYFDGMAWPVRRGCPALMMEQIAMQPLEPGSISDSLRDEVAALEERVDVFRLGTQYDAALPALVQPYLDGTQTWEECYAAIEKEWSYLDE